MTIKLSIPSPISLATRFLFADAQGNLVLRQKKHRGILRVRLEVLATRRKVTPGVVFSIRWEAPDYGIRCSFPLVPEAGIEPARSLRPNGF